MFDNLCSIGWCGLNRRINLLHVMIYIIDILAIFILVTAFVLVYISLRRHERNIVQSTSTQVYIQRAASHTSSLSKICLKLFSSYI